VPYFYPTRAEAHAKNNSLGRRAQGP
jgi:hypothetical protein